MRFLIIGDLHGNIPNIPNGRFDSIIAPGDFCSDAPREYMFKSLKERHANPKTAREWWQIAGKNTAKKMVLKSLSDGRRILEKLNDVGVPVYAVPGNWDWTGNPKCDWKLLRKNRWPELLEGLHNVHDCYHKLVDGCTHDFIGHGITSGPEYPQTKEELKRGSKRELAAMRRDYLAQTKTLDRLFSRATKPVLFLSHNVPYNTPIDKILNKQSPRYGQHFGSVIAREMVIKHRPAVCIGGHMHEHHRAVKLNGVACINAGFGSDVSTVLEMNFGRIERLTFRD